MGSLLLVLLMITSCSEKGDIPYIEENKDNLQPIYYHDASGTYSGELTTTYSDGSTKTDFNHEMKITEMNFDSVSMRGVSNILDWDLHALLYRVTDGIYLAFEEKVDEDQVLRGVPLVGRPEFNGINEVSTGYIEFTVEVITGTDTVEQYYFGKNNSND